MTTRKTLATLVLLGLTALPAAATTAQNGPAQNGPARASSDQQALAPVAAAFPTWWVGEFPPYPPYGYLWRFSHRDFWGNAVWYLVRC